ncbi:MAG TPA: TolC family outer membrane protein [Fontimonas sp.]
MICAAKPRKNQGKGAGEFGRWFARTAIAAAVLAVSLPAAAMTLSEAFERAKAHDPSIAVADAQYAADRELSSAVRGERLPSLSVGGKYQYAKTESNGVFGQSEDEYPSWSAQVVARQPLFRLDWFALGDRAQALDEQADITFRNAQLDVLRRVAERYFGVLLAQDELAQAEAETKAVRESLDDTQKRYDVELVPGMDLKEAQARDDLSRARLLAARTSLQTSRDALDEITGNGNVELPQLPEDVAFPPLSPASPDAWVQAARAQSPRIALAAKAAIVAATDRKSAQSVGLPQLDLVASAGRDDTSDYDFGQETDDARIGVELNIPLYAGGVNAANLRKAEANAIAAEANLKRVTLETERETRQLYRQVETAYYESEAYKKSLESAQLAERAVAAGYDAGTRTITDVLDAKSRVVQARRDLNRTRYQMLQSLIQLKQLTGELSEKDFAEIDQLLSYPPAH